MGRERSFRTNALVSVRFGAAIRDLPLERMKIPNALRASGMTPGFGTSPADVLS